MAKSTDNNDNKAKKPITIAQATAAGVPNCKFARNLITSFDAESAKLADLGFKVRNAELSVKQRILAQEIKVSEAGMNLNQIATADTFNCDSLIAAQNTLALANRELTQLQGLLAEYFTAA